MIPDFKTAAQRSEWIKNNADMFTAVRFHGRGRYERHEYSDYPSAAAAAKRIANESGKHFMVYAVAGIYDTWIQTIPPEEVKP